VEPSLIISLANPDQEVRLRERVMGSRCVLLYPSKEMAVIRCMSDVVR
jgi:hypothetical protein